MEGGVTVAAWLRRISGYTLSSGPRRRRFAPLLCSHLLENLLEDPVDFQLHGLVELVDLPLDLLSQGEDLVELVLPRHHGVDHDTVRVPVDHLEPHGLAGDVDALLEGV